MGGPLSYLPNQAEAFRLKDHFRDVTPLRADGQGRSIRQQSQPFQRAVRLRVSAAALRSVEHRGGLDDFLVKAHDSQLSEDAVKLKREIVRKRAESTKAEAA